MFLSVLFLILKIIGILLLFILAVILAVAAALLLSRIKYGVKCGNDSGTYLSSDISYIFGVIKANVNYAESNLDICLKAFGKQIYPKKKKTVKKSAKKNTEDKSENKEKDKPAVKNELKDNEIIKPEEKIKQKEIQKKEILEEKKKPEEKRLSWEERFGGKEYERNKEDDENFGVIRIKMREIKLPEDEKTDTIKEENSESENSEKENPTENENENKSKINAEYFLKMPMEDKKLIAGGLFKLLKRIIKTVFPKSIKINGTVGIGSPEYTGLLLALCGIIKGLFIEDLNINGDFDKAVFIGNAQFSGRFTLGYLLYCAIRFVLIKPVRRTIILYIKN